jgi:hypothetical protein
LLPRANPAACPQLAKADFASSSQHVREGQRIAEPEAEIEALQRQALALGAEPTADFAPWVLLGVKIDQCPHSAEGDIRALNEGSGLTPGRTFPAETNSSMNRFGVEGECRVSRLAGSRASRNLGCRWSNPAAFDAYLNISPSLDLVNAS